MKARWCLAAWCVFTAAGAFGQTATSGSIQCKVVDESGKPVPGAGVSCSRIRYWARTADGRRVNLPGEVNASASGVSDAAGTFQSSSLPPGHYRVCAGAAGYLNSCEWFPTPNARMASGQTVQYGNIVLRKAGQVLFRVNDPSGLLPAKQDPIRTPLILGVRDAGRGFHAAREISKDAAGRTFQVDVPLNTPVDPWVWSYVYRLVDDTGAPLDTSGPGLSRSTGPAVISSPLAPKTYTITITGRIH